MGNIIRGRISADGHEKGGLRYYVSQIKTKCSIKGHGPDRTDEQMQRRVRLLGPPHREHDLRRRVAARRSRHLSGN